MNTGVTVAIVAVAGLFTAAQTPAPTRLSFEVASIKRSPQDAKDTRWGSEPGRWYMRNVAVSVMVREAYPTQARDLIGAADWVTTEPYDVDARAEGNPTRDQIRLMLQTLLSERFKLRLHYETLERPVYALTVARADGRTSAGLAPSKIDCDAVTAARRENRTADIPAPPNGAPACGFGSSYGPEGVTLRFGGAPLSRLGESLSVPDNRIVLDRTGLAGGYEFTLTYTQQPEPGDDKASLFTALEEQLGLKLVPDRAPLQVLAIDHIERPTEN
jgi:uncharacterized protein (TIGR03435 family)